VEGVDEEGACRRGEDISVMGWVSMMEARYDQTGNITYPYSWGSVTIILRDF